jgi:hypothetical protein
MQTVEMGGGAKKENCPRVNEGGKRRTWRTYRPPLFSLHPLLVFFFFFSLSQRFSSLAQINCAYIWGLSHRYQPVYIKCHKNVTNLSSDTSMYQIF